METGNTDLLNIALINKRGLIPLQQRVGVFLPHGERVALAEFAATLLHVHPLLAKLLFPGVFPDAFVVRNGLESSVEGSDLFRFWFVGEELESEFHFLGAGWSLVSTLIEELDTCFVIEAFVEPGK